MKREIERRFLVPRLDAVPAWDTAPVTLLRQAYLHNEPSCTIRVRLREGKDGENQNSADEHAWLTIKGTTHGAARDEFEYAIPKDEAVKLYAMATSGRVAKYRRIILNAGQIWELDTFIDENEGLIIAEAELDHEEQPLDLPPWIGPEVTLDSRYSNAALARTPWPLWKKT